MNLATFFRTVFSRITGNSARRGAVPARCRRTRLPAPYFPDARRKTVELVADNRRRGGVGGLGEHVDQKASHCGR